MERVNECRPLLHSFEQESWRSRMRKRCMRIPSEVTITGVILGLFLLVVTLLIVLENMETSNKNELTLENDMLASPFKYNKKVIDQSWQNKKEAMKPKKESKNKKWDNVNKGWKKIADLSDGTKLGMTNEDVAMNFYNALEKIEDPALPIDEYGKEIDDSLETLLDPDWSIANAIKDVEEDETGVLNLIQASNIKWKKIDDGWKKLSDQGWKHKEIKEALITALRESQNETAGTLQFPLNFDDFWDNINDSWKKHMHKGEKEKEKQKNINDEWTNKMTVLQSPNSSDKKGKQNGDGLKDLINQGWKDKEVEDALINAWKKKQSVLKSPMGVQNLWGKTIAMLKNLLAKRTENEDSQSTNDKWGKGMKLLMSSEKLSKLNNDKGFQILFKEGWKEKEIKKALISALKEKEDSLESHTSFKNFIDDIIQSIKDHQKDKIIEYKKETTNSVSGNNNHLLQSYMPLDKNDKEDIGDGITKLLEEGWNIYKIKQAIYKAWKENKRLKKWSMGDNGPMKWKKVNDGWKKISISS